LKEKEKSEFLRKGSKNRCVNQEDKAEEDELRGDDFVAYSVC
jgi:hypothetical protein